LLLVVQHAGAALGVLDGGIEQPGLLLSGDKCRCIVAFIASSP
jgi:hypothetical protein